MLTYVLTNESEFEVEHNLGTIDYMVTIYDEDNNLIIPYMVFEKDKVCIQLGYFDFTRQWVQTKYSGIITIIIRRTVNA